MNGWGFQAGWLDGQLDPSLSALLIEPASARAREGEKWTKRQLTLGGRSQRVASRRTIRIARRRRTVARGGRQFEPMADSSESQRRGPSRATGLNCRGLWALASERKRSIRCLGRERNPPLPPTTTALWIF